MSVRKASVRWCNVIVRARSCVSIRSGVGPGVNSLSLMIPAILVFSVRSTRVQAPLVYPEFRRGARLNLVREAAVRTTPTRVGMKRSQDTRVRRRHLIAGSDTKVKGCGRIGQQPFGEHIPVNYLLFSGNAKTKSMDGGCGECSLLSGYKVER